MNRTVIALYDHFSSANDAVKELGSHGFDLDDISLISSDSSGEYALELPPATESSTTVPAAGIGAGIGATLGGVGGLLVGLGALTIPGIGPVVAAGPLAAALAAVAGAGIGAVTGGLLAALIDLGIPEDSAQYFTEGVRRGGTLVSVRTTEERASEAMQIMNHHHPVDIHERASTWRQSGWAGVNPDVDPYLTQEEGWQRGAYQVEESHPGTSGGYEDFEYYEPGFREHFASTGYSNEYTYNYFRPAYHYGYTLAMDEQYWDRDWEKIEPVARSYWEKTRPATWERFKGSVQHAWEDVKATINVKESIS